jgi:hypothetical protein
MKVHVTPELEARLTHSALQQGRNRDELVQEARTLFRRRGALRRGRKARRRMVRTGEYLTHEQVGRHLERFLRP